MNSGILLVDKPRGMTSHDVVSRVRRLAGTRKVGHAGTLDPMATGLLMIGVDDATRLLHYLVGLDKEYTATVRLGWGTTTDDAEGEALESAPADAIAAVTDGDVLAGLRALTGDLEQVPSSVSAIKVDGKRAYARVRGGEAVELAPRPVHVAEFELLALRRTPASSEQPGSPDPPGSPDQPASSDQPASIDLDVRVAVSSGTYVRALARDLGAVLGVGGHLTALRRTRVGRFQVADASELDGLDVAETIVRAADAARLTLPVVELDPQAAIDLGHGKRIAAPADARVGAPMAAIAGDRLVAIVERRGEQLKVLTGFPAREDA